MKESYGEGQAGHTGPESCAGGREGAGEALTGVRAGWVLSLETPKLRGADAVHGARKATLRVSLRQRLGDPAGSKTPCTLGNSSHRNWEIPRSTSPSGEARVMNPQRTR